MVIWLQQVKKKIKKIKKIKKKLKKKGENSCGQCGIGEMSSFINPTVVLNNTRIKSIILGFDFSFILEGMEKIKKNEIKIKNKK